MRFDYCHNVKKLPVPLTREFFEKLIHAPWLAEMAARIASGNLDEKRNLPAACWQAAYNGQRRANTTATSSGLFALDVDHVTDPEALYATFKDRIPELGIYVVHKTPSTHGLRVVARCRSGLTTIGENQSWLAREINVQHDAATHDFARLSYLVPADYFYYYNPAIFTDEPDVVLTTCPDICKHQVSAPSGNTLLFKGVPYSEIVADLVRRMGGEPAEGERNRTLFNICRYLANITDRKADLIYSICPRFGLSDDEVRSCCNSACRYNLNSRLPAPLYHTLRHFGIDCSPSALSSQPAAETETDAEILASLNSSLSTLTSGISAIILPPVEHLPPLIREFVATAPADFREATALVCLPVCGFLGSRLRCRYIDGEIQSPSFIVNIIAPAASGKSVLLRVPDICLRRVRELDNEGRELEAEYNRQLKLMKNAKKQLPEPQPIVRDIPVKVSVAQLLKRMMQARGLHLISISPEADTMTNSNKSGSWAMKSDIYRIAQDADGGRFGQDYKSDVSYSATCQMRYNLVTLGTPGAMARAYPDVEDGLITRCIMATLPDQFGKPMPVRQELSRRQQQVIDDKVRALMALCQDAEGNVLPEHNLSLPWLQDAVSQWIEVQRIRAVRDQDYARDQFRRRAALIGFRAGMVAAFLWGKLNRERKGFTIEFAIWVAEYILQSLLDRYSQRVNEAALGYETPKAQRYPSLYDAMGDVFTIPELRRAAIAQGCHSPVKTIIFRWNANGLIQKQGDSFVKLIK